MYSIEILDVREAIYSVVEALLTKGEMVRLRMVSRSMLPAIKFNDYIVVKKVPVSCLRPGAIILYQFANSFYTHRLLYTSGNRLRTKGDRLPYLDPPMLQAQFLGKVIAIERNGKLIKIDTLKYDLLNLWRGLLSFVVGVNGSSPLLHAIYYKLLTHRHSGTRKSYAKRR